MKNLIAIPFLVCLFLSLTAAPYVKKDKDPCFCNKKSKKFTKLSHQQRRRAKHLPAPRLRQAGETGYDTFSTAKNTITPETMIGWEEQYGSITKKIKTHANTPLSRRQEGTPEDSLYTLDGWLYYVGMEDNDCDFHIEIGSQDSGKPRVVVEVTVENCALRNKIRDALRSQGDSIFNFSSSNKKKCHYSKGIRVNVVGLGFYDASHRYKQKKNKKTKKLESKSWGHGDYHTLSTSWELHPVKEIIFVGVD